MTIIIIVAILWGVSALVRMAEAQKQRDRVNRINREAQRTKAEQARMREEWRMRLEESKAETARLIALEREQMRMAKEQERQAAQLAKHEEQIAKLEQRMAVAEGEIDFQRQQIDRLRDHIEHAETERDACVYGSSEYWKWDKKCLALEKQIHTAEGKISNAQFTISEGKKKMEVA